ncbi:hypothetical protein Gohar_006684 [Gossypium harknessii]|uniref:Uncharacterized protein n=1 Tax=Gossypium harknessii TaxID=34285 RepID=A0A7J9GE74_9ROSI|nr:hypothetical protein [Gossypium harknessii]
MDVDVQNLSIDDREEEELEIQTDEDITISLETLSGSDYQAWDLGLYLIQFFNVKVDDLPSGFVSRSLEKSLGDLMGTYLKYYTSAKTIVECLSKYQRQRLLMLGRKRLGWSEASTSGQGCSLGGVVMQGSCMQNVTGIDGREDELLEVGEAKNVPVVHCRVLSHPEEQTFRHSSNLR